MNPISSRYLHTLLDAVRPVARYARLYRHHDYPIDAPVRSTLLIALEDYEEENEGDRPTAKSARSRTPCYHFP